MSEGVSEGDSVVTTPSPHVCVQLQVLQETLQTVPL